MALLDVMTGSIGELCTICARYGYERISWTGRLLDVTDEIFHMTQYKADEDLSYDGEVFGLVKDVTTFYVKGQVEEELMAKLNPFPGTTTNE